MGGCRCSYRNCSSRSDGKIHMFHFPVFDRVRCHQWLTNAQKLEFLNLKVSQLKNRVICQYHFKDECFMNFKKDKLTFDAVPSIDGPNCDTSQQEKNLDPEDSKSLYMSISLDDIENDYLSLLDKKANFSVKYGDFLTNCDLISLQTLDEKNQDVNITSDHSLLMLDQIPSRPSMKPITPVKVKPAVNTSKKTPASKSKVSNNNIYKRSNKPGGINVRNDLHKTGLTHSLGEKEQEQNTTLNVLNVPVEFESLLNDQQLQKSKQVFEIQKLDQSFEQNSDQSFVQKPEQSFNHLDESFNQKPGWSLIQKPVESFEVQTMDQSFVQKPNQSYEVTVLNDAVPHGKNPKTNIKETKKIRIISEKQVQVPMPIIGKLEPVSPSKVVFQDTSFSLSQPVENTSELNSNNIMETTLQSTDAWKNNYNEKPQSISKRILFDENNEWNNIDRNKRKNVSAKLIYDEFGAVQERIDEQQTNTCTQLINENNELEKITQTDDRTKSISKQLINSGSKDPCQSRVVGKTRTSPSCLLKPVTAKKIIPEERIAAIAEKRKFNMKLRDIIENCLDKLDEPHIPEIVERPKQSIKRATRENRATQCETQVSSYLSKDPELPSVQDYTIAYLESRLKKMENNLLHKIDQNSERIHELRESCFVKPTKIQKKAVHTQTSLSEEQFKRQLYNDISKYLSSDANSLIYEELFIKQFSKEVPKSSPSPKRRKCNKRSKKSS